MVQPVQCRCGVLCSKKNSCKTMKTNIFTSGKGASFLASTVWSEQSLALANGRASGCRRQAEGRAEYIVTLMRLSGSS